VGYSALLGVTAKLPHRKEEGYGIGHDGGRKQVLNKRRVFETNLEQECILAGNSRAPQVAIVA
jgi:hypothetical protein